MFLALLPAVYGHGRLMDPPGRGSLFRFVTTNPLLSQYSSVIEADYDDMGANCGGVSYQISQGYKCGPCGDPYGASQPRAHEDGGKYGKKIVSKQYSSGNTIMTQVQITAHHKGWIRFNLCPLDELGAGDDALENCLSNYPLETEQGFEWDLPDTHNGDYNNGGYWYDILVKLPDGVECDRCVLRWKYHGGNSWGCDAPDDCGLGKGYQEEFRNCADIQIIPNDSSVTVTAPPITTEEPTTLAEGQKCGSWQEQFPNTVLDTSSLTTDKNPTGCTTEPNGHLGEKFSYCFITCPENFNMVFDDPTVPAWKTRTGIQCRGSGMWLADSPFTCQNPCPDTYNLNKKKFVLVKKEWPTGFELWIRLKPVMDMNEWTVVFYFFEPLDKNVEFHTWEAQLTVSANSQIATLTNWPWNTGIAAGEIYPILFVVSGASRALLPPYRVFYLPGKYEDMSCLLENNFNFGEFNTTTTSTTAAVRFL